MSKGETGAKPTFATVFYINKRGYVWRSELEAYKTALVRHALGGQPEPLPLTRAEHDALVPLKTVGAELGVGRRTIGRRIRGAETTEGFAVKAVAPARRRRNANTLEAAVR
jgi:hypothetical protein